MTCALDDHNDTFRLTVDKVARALSEVRHDADASYISLPILYPSGAMVVVRLERHQADHFLVSDAGFGFAEADAMGAGRLFTHSAPAVAARSGIHLDHHAFVVAVRQDRLPGAISVIAACSQEAVQLAAFRLDEKKRTDAADRLCERLFRLFTPANVTRGAEMRGASNTPWTVTALVQIDHHRAVYEPISEHAASVASAMTKFVDLNHLESPPARIAVVRSKAALDTKLALIATAAHVVEEDVSDQTLERLALLPAA